MVWSVGVLYVDKNLLIFVINENKYITVITLAVKIEQGSTFK